MPVLSFTGSSISKYASLCPITSRLSLRGFSPMGTLPPATVPHGAGRPMAAATHPD